MRLSPRTSSIGRVMRKNRRDSCSVRRPASWIRYTNGAALPSMIGTSGWFNSTTALSIPRLASAASRCSTVSTEPSLRASPVAYSMPAMF